MYINTLLLLKEMQYYTATVHCYNTMIQYTAAIHCQNIIIVAMHCYDNGAILSCGRLLQNIVTLHSCDFLPRYIVTIHTAIHCYNTYCNTLLQYILQYIVAIHTAIHCYNRPTLLRSIAAIHCYDTLLQYITTRHISIIHCYDTLLQCIVTIQLYNTLLIGYNTGEMPIVIFKVPSLINEYTIITLGSVPGCSNVHQ